MNNTVKENTVVTPAELDMMNRQRKEAISILEKTNDPLIIKKIFTYAWTLSH